MEMTWLETIQFLGLDLQLALLLLLLALGLLGDALHSAWVACRQLFAGTRVRLSLPHRVALGQINRI